jgi:hypothetical protein
MGTYNGTENGRGAWVALCTYPNHTDTDMLGNVSGKFTTKFSPTLSSGTTFHIGNDSYRKHAVELYIETYCDMLSLR